MQVVDQDARHRRVVRPHDVEGHRERRQREDGQELAHQPHLVSLCDLAQLGETRDGRGRFAQAAGEQHVSHAESRRRLDRALTVIDMIGGGNDRFQIEPDDAGVVETSTHLARGGVAPRRTVEPDAARRPSRLGRYPNHVVRGKVGMHSRSDRQNTNHTATVPVDG